MNDLVQGGLYSAVLDSTELDPLREEDALQEAQLLDSRVCYLTSTAAVIFELRTSLHFYVGNSALLVVRGLRSFDWNSPTRLTPLAALTVMSSIPGQLGESFHVKFGLFPEAHLSLVGDLAEFYVLESEGLGEAPPDYSSLDLRQVQDNLPSWSSACSLLQASISR
ncbi:hypothetical protein [Streptomyces luteireticuli]|uniref:hypothetical protein n=1 Tax=Streptomyces luteireticuli TaxID=173858 RepID=UPI00355805D8